MCVSWIMFTFHESLCPFFFEKSSYFPLYLSEKAYYHKPTLVTWCRLFKNQTTELIEKWVQIVKIYNGSRRG